MRKPRGNGVRVVVARDEYRAIASVVEALRRSPPYEGCVGLEAVVFPYNTKELVRALDNLAGKLARARFGQFGTSANIGVSGDGKLVT